MYARKTNFFFHFQLYLNETLNFYHYFSQKNVLMLMETHVPGTFKRLTQSFKNMLRNNGFQVTISSHLSHLFFTFEIITKSLKMRLKNG